MSNLYDREAFLIGNTVLQVWESRTGWKWSIFTLEDNSPFKNRTGYGCDSQTTALLMALSEITQQTLYQAGSDKKDELIALFPGLEAFRHTD